MGTEQDNGAIVRRLFERVWNGGDLSAIEDLVDDQFTNFGVRQPGGHAAIRHIATAWRTAFPDLHSDIQEEIVHDDKVVLRVIARGTHLGELPPSRPGPDHGGHAAHRPVLRGRPDTHPPRRGWQGRCAYPGDEPFTKEKCAPREDTPCHHITRKFSGIGAVGGTAPSGNLNSPARRTRRAGRRSGELIRTRTGFTPSTGAGVASGNAFKEL